MHSHSDIVAISCGTEVATHPGARSGRRRSPRSGDAPAAGGRVCVLRDVGLRPHDCGEVLAAYPCQGLGILTCVNASPPIPDNRLKRGTRNGWGQQQGPALDRAGPTHDTGHGGVISQGFPLRVPERWQPHRDFYCACRFSPVNRSMLSPSSVATCAIAAGDHHAQEITHCQQYETLPDVSPYRSSPTPCAAAQATGEAGSWAKSTGVWCKNNTG